MTLRERINEAIHLTNKTDYDTAAALYDSILADSPNNKRALYAKAVNLYNMSYDSEYGMKIALVECLRCCKLYVKDEPAERHMKVKNLALMAYESLLNMETGIWIEV